MKKRFIFPLTALALTLSANAFANEKTQKEKNNELVGLGVGTTVGALVGGPIGAIVGGFFGVVLGDDVNDTYRLKEKDTALATQKSKLAEQQNQLVALQSQYDSAQKANALQLVRLETQVEKVMQEMASDVLFRTASHTIEKHFKAQLDLVAQGLKANPDFVVTLSGYADSRGDDAYNQSLSEKRAKSVSDYLIAKGVDSKQIVTASYGETQPVSQQTTHEDFFFDRRVIVHISKSDQAMTASNQ